MTPPDRDLRQRLEILRVQGARHRLELAMALQALVTETGGIRRGAGMVLSVLGMAAGTGGGKGWMRALGRGLVPILLSVFAGSRAARSVGHLRSTLELGALGLIVLRYLKRVLRRTEAPPEAE
jgi:hypothetical protein